MKFLLIIGVALIVFLVIDFIWLVFISRKLYDRELKDIKKDKVSWIPALIFYLIYIIGVSFFVIMPAVDKGSLLYSIGGGALFGLVAYSTYDLTNLATMKGFPLKITVIDLVWGSFVTSAVCTITYLITK